MRLLMRFMRPYRGLIAVTLFAVLIDNVGTLLVPTMLATGHTPASISKIRNGKVKAIRLKTLLDICVELDCQPGDLIKRVNERELEELATRRARNALSRATATGDDPVLESDHVYVVDLRDD